MPLPTPNTNENKKEFISRCIKELNETEKNRFPVKGQIAAVCYSQWDKKEKTSKEHFLFTKLYLKNNFEYGYIYVNNLGKDIVELCSKITKSIDKTNENETIINDFHLTLFFGITDEDYERIISLQDLNDLCKSEQVITELLCLDIFTDNADYDILILKVKPVKSLLKLRENLMNNLNLINKSGYDEYIPHITLAYLDKGKCDEYLELNNKVDFSNYVFMINDINIAREDGSYITVNVL